jgi:hypothetical protein
MRTRQSFLCLIYASRRREKGKLHPNSRLLDGTQKQRYANKTKYSQFDLDFAVTAVAQVVVDVKEWEEHSVGLHWPSSAAGAVVPTYRNIITVNGCAE